MELAVSNRWRERRLCWCHFFRKTITGRSTPKAFWWVEFLEKKSLQWTVGSFGYCCFLSSNSPKSENKKPQKQRRFWKQSQSFFKSGQTKHRILVTGGDLPLFSFAKLGWSHHFRFITFLLWAKTKMCFVITLQFRCYMCTWGLCSALCKLVTRNRLLSLEQ